MPMRTSSNPALYTFDAAKRAEHGNICGVDGSWTRPPVRPVCVAAVILNPDDPIEGVNDSKKLSEKRREALFDEIIARALCYQIVFYLPRQEIDERNILWATMDGMEQAVAGLAVTPDYVLVDGNRCPPNLAQPARGVVKGDCQQRPVLRQLPFWPKSAVTGTCWSWINSTRNTSWPNIKVIPPSSIMS